MRGCQPTPAYGRQAGSAWERNRGILGLAPWGRAAGQPVGHEADPVQARLLCGADDFDHAAIGHGGIGTQLHLGVGVGFGQLLQAAQQGFGGLRLVVEVHSPLGIDHQLDLVLGLRRPGGEGGTVLFGGDLGRYNRPILPDPSDGVQTDVLEALMAEHKPKLVYLIPTFGNPSGATLSLGRRKKVLELAVKYNTLIVEDDPYGDLYFGKAPPPSLLALSKTVPGSRELLAHCGSLSKVLSPGLRVGWMIAPPELLAKATMCKQFSDAHTSTFAQATAAQYLQAGRMPATLAKVRAVYAERAKTMCDALQRELGNAIEFVAPKGGLFVWARLTGADGQLANGNELAKRAIDKGVAFVPGTPFYATNPDHATLRLSFATVGPDKIVEGVGRLAAALKASA